MVRIFALSCLVAAACASGGTNGQSGDDAPADAGHTGHDAAVTHDSAHPIDASHPIDSSPLPDASHPIDAAPLPDASLTDPPACTMDDQCIAAPNECCAIITSGVGICGTSNPIFGCIPNV